MSETAADREYYAAGEAAFIRRRGTPFLLSPKDFGLLKEWRALGVPIEAVEQGIDDAFSRREERGATGRVNSLSYCRDAVLSAWERRAEAAVGRGSGRSAADSDGTARIEELIARLSELCRRSPELAGPLDAASRSLDRLRRGRKSPGEIETSLARVDRRLAGDLYAALSEPERARIDREVEQSLARARLRMDGAAAEKTSRALRRRAVRERLGLPRLTLLP